jgi:hypothetical protein
VADIHVLETPEQDGERVVNVVYHVPIDTTNNAYPGGQTSQIEADLEQSEIDALADGSLREVSHTFRFGSGMSTSEMADRVQAFWHDAASAEQARIDTEYEHYLTTLSRS